MHVLVGRVVAAVLCIFVFPSWVAAANTVTLPLFQDANHLGYFANISIGTPPQNAVVSIDTGSADLWIFSNNVNCTPSNACSGSSFDPSRSSSFKSVAQGEFLAEYAGGNGAAGDYISETVQIGGATVNNVILGLATEAGSPNGLTIQGIMGLGMLFDESLRSENGHGYFNLPYRLSANGLIDETVFSVYLDDINSQTSSLLFGGIDTDKYDGELAVFDVPPTANGLVEYLVYISSMSIIGSEGNSTSLTVPGESSGGTSALLDTGSTAMSLPVSLVREIYEQFEVEVANVGPVVPCSLANSGASFAFGLGGSSGPTINVPITEVVRKTNLIDNPNICFFDIFPQNDDASSVAVLGDSFLRAAYVVFDPGNGQIGIAQAKINVASSNVQALSQNGAVPTGEALLAVGDLGDGASFGGGIPGSTIGSGPLATAPLSAAAVQTTGLRPSSASAVVTPLATGASAASVLASGAASGTSVREAAATSTAAPQSVAKETPSSSSTVSIPRFSGVAVGVSAPVLSPLLGLVVGAFMMV